MDYPSPEEQLRHNVEELGRPRPGLHSKLTGIALIISSLAGLKAQPYLLVLSLACIAGALEGVVRYTFGNVSVGIVVAMTMSYAIFCSLAFWTGYFVQWMGWFQLQ
jgi:hypothetical protein